jgi:hypothetical protein
MSFGLGFWAAAGAGGGASAGAYEQISTVYGTGSSGVITFNTTGLGSTYKHLQLRAVARDSSGTTDNTGCVLRFNADTGSNYARHRLRGDGSSALSAAATSQTSINIFTLAVGNGAPSGVHGAAVIDILDPFSTSKNKTVRALTGFAQSGSNSVELDSGLYLSTSALTEITVTTSSGNWLTTSRFSLYGIKG